jgi:hypothetical protein
MVQKRYIYVPVVSDWFVFVCSNSVSIHCRKKHKRLAEDDE